MNATSVEARHCLLASRDDHDTLDSRTSNSLLIAITALSRKYASLYIPCYCDRLENLLGVLNVIIVSSVGKDFERSREVQDICRIEKEHRDRVDFLVCGFHCVEWKAEDGTSADNILLSEYY